MSNCRACGFPTTQFLYLRDTPLADKFPADPGEWQKTYPLIVTVCQTCWLVQLDSDTDVPDNELFGSDYAFYSGSSPALVKHFKEYAAWVMKEFPEQVENGVVEIASNDGTLLEQFPRGPKRVGIDPAAPAKAAQQRAVATIMYPFTSELADRLEQRNCVVIANNVIAHVRDPNDFVEGIATLLGKSGVAIIEFQYLGDLILGNQWDLFYHEHRSYFSIQSLTKLVERHGLRIASQERVQTQGGSMRVVIVPEHGHAGKAERWLRNMATYDSMQGRVDYSVRKLRQVIDDFGVVAGYAATAKATTLIHYSGICNYVEYVVDTTPYKIGRYMPGTLIPIVGEDEVRPAPPAYLLLARNYLSGFMRRERAYLDVGGEVIVPLPNAEVIS